MNQIKKPFCTVRIVLLVLTLATIIMAFLPMLEVEKSRWMGFDNPAEKPTPIISAQMIDGAWLLAIGSAIRGVLVTLKKPAADAISAILAVMHSAWILFVPYAREIIRNMFQDMRTFAYDPIVGSNYVYSYALTPLAWLLIGINGICLLMTVVVMVRDKNAS